MSNSSANGSGAAVDGGAGGTKTEVGADRARPLPRISIQAFCDNPQMAEVVQTASEDRRLSKAHVSVHMGGSMAAVAHFQESPTPNLIVIESGLARGELIADLDKLAESCDAGTKVVIIGQLNDVLLYRELLKRGVSEYLVWPVSTLQLMEAFSNLYNDPKSDPVGHVYAFIGAKGGVGSSTICHNAGWALSEILQGNVVVADFDLPFGTAGLDFNQDPVQGLAEAISSPERLDEVLLDRLLTKCSERLSLFAAPVTLEKDFDMSPDACGMVIDVVRQNVPYVAVDLPHIWSPWTKRIVTEADEVVITAAPDLANLRNTKNLVDLLKQSRTNDRPPLLVLNTVGMPKRPEIGIKEFCQAIDLQTSAIIEFDGDTFGQAANNGQMIEELNPKAKAVQGIRDLAFALTHRKDNRSDKKTSAFGPLLAKLKLTR